MAISTPNGNKIKQNASAITGLNIPPESSNIVWQKPVYNSEELNDPALTAIQSYECSAFNVDHACSPFSGYSYNAISVNLIPFSITVGPTVDVQFYQDQASCGRTSSYVLASSIKPIADKGRIPGADNVQTTP